MLQVESALKDLYKADSTDKNIVLHFYHPGTTTPYLMLWESNYILNESMEIDESLSSTENIDFGSCEATQFKITLIDVEKNIKGSDMVVYQTLEGQYPELNLYPDTGLFPSGYMMPLGRYVIQSADRQTNRKYRDVIALDYMSKFDIDVSEWYQALLFPVSLKAFRSSLCRYVGVEESVPDFLPNDTIMIEKTLDAGQLVGRDVLVACEQMNGVFGHFDRNGILQHIALQPNYTLLPVSDLYPSDNLYPILPGEMNEQVYDEDIAENLLRSPCRFEEYTVKSIDRVQIRQEEGDIGAFYGSDGNCLTIQGNFLLFGKAADELKDIAQGIHGMVSSRQYTPHEVECKGMPYLEVGDTELISLGDANIISYIMKRTLKGICALKDAHSTTGEETRSTESGVNVEIIQLKGKAAFLTKSVDEVSVRVIDLAKNTDAKFAITAEQISAEVKRANEAEAVLKIQADQISTSVKNLKDNTESQIKQMSDQILMKVSKGDVSSQISIESGGISIFGDRFSWSSTYSSMSADGKLRCVDGEFNGYIQATSGKIGGFLIEGDSLRSGGDSSIDFGNVTIDNTGLLAGNWSFSDDNISCMAGIIANDDGNVFVHNSSYYNGKSVAYALDDLRRRIGGSGCGSDCSGDCDDWCDPDNDHCNSDDLINDL
ncbi:MAG: hypothetical protein PHV18_14885 [Lachnospiraceae bacterium]|nr:hypothetical protein [Lachnospiraceae bacterium]